MRSLHERQDDDMFAASMLTFQALLKEKTLQEDFFQKFIHVFLSIPNYETLIHH